MIPFLLNEQKNPSVIDWNILVDVKRNGEERLVLFAFMRMLQPPC